MLLKGVEDSGAGKSFLDLCRRDNNTNLIFKDDSKMEKGIAKTILLINGRDINEFMFEDDFLAINRQGRMDVVISVNTTWKRNTGGLFATNMLTNLGACAQTLAHEFAIHAAPYRRLIELLRNNTVPLKDVWKFWETSQGVGGGGGHLNEQYQHYKLADAKSKRYIELGGKMANLLGSQYDPEAKRQFLEESVYDIKSHQSFLGVKSVYEARQEWKHSQQ